MSDKPIEEMTVAEKTDEILVLLRQFRDVLTALNSSPMAGMIPGMGKVTTQVRSMKR